LKRSAAHSITQSCLTSFPFLLAILARSHSLAPQGDRGLLFLLALPLRRM
jgi:hypothetical protein